MFWILTIVVSSGFGATVPAADDEHFRRAPGAGGAGGGGRVSTPVLALQGLYHTFASGTPSEQRAVELYASMFADRLETRPFARAMVGSFAELVCGTGNRRVADVGCGPGHLTALLHDLGLEDNTDVFVTADHGFSTTSKQSTQSKRSGGLAE